MKCVKRWENVKLSISFSPREELLAAQKKHHHRIKQIKVERLSPLSFQYPITAQTRRRCQVSPGYRLSFLCASTQALTALNGN